MTMIMKSIFMISVFAVPLIIVISGVVTSVPLLFGLYILSGLGTAGIGMGVMHDAIHGSYSKNATVNKYLGYTMNMIGAYDAVWKVQHNVLHHSYTNIDAHDDDINTPFFLRFSPHAPKNKLHRYQHLYTWFFYCLSTISWITSKDFVRLNRYYKMGLIGDKKAYRTHLVKIIIWKLVYYTYALVLPAVMTVFPFWIVLLAFLCSHFVTGLSMSLVFQTAHVMPNTDYPLPNNEGEIESERLVHQMATTSNYALNSRILSWCIGGLNYQVEHHLFPNICHVHYRKISPIIQETAKEFGVPYLYKKTFISAIHSHYHMLRTLGRMEMQPIPESVNQPALPTV